MLIEEVYLKSLGASMQVLILDEPSEEWQVWRAFHGVLGSQNDVALKLYTTLLEKKRTLRSRDLMTLSNRSRYTVDRNMKNLMTLGLVGCDYVSRGSIESRLWYPEKQVLAMMRLIPEEYFNRGFPKEMMKREK